MDGSELGYHYRESRARQAKEIESQGWLISAVSASLVVLKKQSQLPAVGRKPENLNPKSKTNSKFQKSNLQNKANFWAY
jgi:hypothetical protein